VRRLLRRVLTLRQYPRQRFRRLLVPQDPTGSGVRLSFLFLRNDHLFLDDEALDATDEQGAIGVQALGFG
jgi:hypothetical protein